MRKSKIKWRKRLEFAFVLGLILCLPVLYFWGRVKYQPFDELSSGADFEVTGKFFLSRTKDEKIVLWAEGKNLLYWQGKGKGAFVSPQVNINTHTGVVKISSQKINYKDDTKTFIFWGNVKVKFGQFIIKANQLDYNLESQKISVPSKVFISGQGIEMQGEGAEMDLKLSQLVIKSGVKGKFWR